MSTIQDKLESTINFYNQQAIELIASYNNADMTQLHELLISELSHDSKVLDIGFGSGRDIQFLKDNTFDVWGVDPTQEFVDYAKLRFSDISDHFFKASLPKLDLRADLHQSFDAIILIAVWMHLPKDTYRKAISSIITYLKPGGKIILSYSITPRTEKSSRHFEDIDRSLLLNLFENYGSQRIAEYKNDDGMNKREIKWITEVYTYDPA